MSDPKPSTAAKTRSQIGSPLSKANRIEIIETLSRCVRESEYNQLKLKVPSAEGRLQKRAGMHYHFKPEVFVQICGWTEFKVPSETVTVRPGEACIMPAGVPHHERISSEKGAFRNLVVGFYSNAISVHLAFEVERGKPEIDVIEFYDAPNLDVFLSLTNGLVENSFKSGSTRDHVVKGLSIALFAMLKGLVESGNEGINQDIGKVFQAKWLIREQLSNTELNVKMLAERLQCSPDYLSHLFNTQTEEKLTHYIQRIRIEGAALALQTTPLYVSEIAWSSGFSDPAYFARVFKKFLGISPQEYRAQSEERHRKEESRPKTIYYDRVDYSAGESHRS
ncbi:helix-turn-helix domain-containing protein [Pelagicoccus sp. SDUM812002]|uniref:helix-turn-helix domain-containing protein n=1 Tax=Pelagicoccus sp. SDUM812002 TaxID=3041266 RepID=UPI00280DD01E|nr:helix-turn-helix domain-containing protein [Pelagicoccus sp. SDUM812002]MDQ8185673.1 helix-turn-helix domain-containing protein [Pelagicoccus sp. SDUM812002]